MRSLYLLGVELGVGVGVGVGVGYAPLSSFARMRSLYLLPGLSRPMAKLMTLAAPSWTVLHGRKSSKKSSSSGCHLTWLGSGPGSGVGVGVGQG